MRKQYVITRPLEIQSRPFKAGDVVGAGDVNKGEFVPAKGLENIVALGHVKPRLADGRIEEQAASSTSGRKPKARKLKENEDEHA